MVKGLLNKHIGNEGVPNIHRKMSAMDTVTKQMTWEALLLYKQKGMYCSIAFTQSSRKPKGSGDSSVRRTCIICMKPWVQAQVLKKFNLQQQTFSQGADSQKGFLGQL